MRPTLFDQPLSHRNDPATSYEAAGDVKRSDTFKRQKDAVYETLKRHNGRTSAELAYIMDVDRWLTARRLPDLKREGKVKQGEPRYCTATHRNCVTWWIK